jgi:hypothetical protein
LSIFSLIHVDAIFLLASIPVAAASNLRLKISKLRDALMARMWPLDPITNFDYDGFPFSTSQM